MEETFMYYAYGSNLLKKRIHINNPTAEFIGIGRLEDHQLDFMKYSDHWRGTSATLVPMEGSHVWGAIWSLSKSDLPSLDKQEGVETNWYFPKTVTVFTPDGEAIECRTYQQSVLPPTRGEFEDIPHERRPSITYLDCILKGALECQLPDYYVKKLSNITHNGLEASDKMVENLEPYIYTLRKLGFNPDEERSFLYFAYGSNMLQRRVHMDNPTAIFISIGRLDNYRIDFMKYSKFWNGPTITIVPTANAHIWGVVYRLRKNNILSLDNQKGVDIKKYYARKVTIVTPYMGEFICRVYEQRLNALPRGDKETVPLNQWPSKTYMKVIIEGAIDCGLPEYYIKMLKKIQHNDEEGCFRMEELLRRFTDYSPCRCRWPGRYNRKELKLKMNTEPEVENIWRNKYLWRNVLEDF